MNCKQELQAARGGPRQQLARAPIDPDERTLWACSAKGSTKVVKELKLQKLLGKKLQGKAIAEIGDEVESGWSAKAPRKRHLQITGADALSRWDKANIVVAMVAHVVENGLPRGCSDEEVSGFAVDAGPSWFPNSTSYVVYVLVVLGAFWLGQACDGAYNGWDPFVCVQMTQAIKGPPFAWLTRGLSDATPHNQYALA